MVHAIIALVAAAAARRRGPCGRHLADDHRMLGDYARQPLSDTNLSLSAAQVPFTPPSANHSPENLPLVLLPLIQ